MKNPERLIQRPKYIERITPFMGKSLIKVLVGQRRVGKSYVLLQLMELIKTQNTSANIIYINCEDMEFSDIKTAKQLHDYILAKWDNATTNHIFIDEIQDIEEFENALRSLLLKDGNDIYVTGSNAKLLSGELATYLSGRYVEFPIYSLSYPEFLDFHQLQDSTVSFKLYEKFGGLPYLIHLQLTDEIAWEYLRNIYTTILYRDVIMRYNIRSNVFFDKLVRFLADNIGSIFSSKKISDYLKSQQTNISSVQIQNFVNYLSNAFLIHRASRYDIVGKRIFEIGEKYYFENMGIRNSLIGYKASDKAKILENIVYNHLLYMNYNIKIGVVGNHEIDFICEKQNERIYIQVSYEVENENTYEREFGNLLKIQDNYPKWVISNDDFDGHSIEGILVIPIRKFLLMDF